MINNEFNKDLKTLLYLGPKGSYSDAAKDKFIKLYGLNPSCMPLSSIMEVVRELKSVNSNEYAAVIPIENSIEGIVRETIDNLAELAVLNIKVLAETKLSVEHCLISFASDKSMIKTISSHPQALAQCRSYIFNTWKGNVKEEPVLSTSCAVNRLTCECPESAAVASEYCAKIYNIPINDEQNNTTRFILLGKSNTSKSVNSKTSITFSTENRPGALNKILGILEKFSINMSYIDSRPSRKQLGEYVFYIDFEGHITDEGVQQALSELKNQTTMLEVLGSYDVLD